MSRLPLVDRWGVGDDPARGRRRVLRDRAGRVIAVEGSDGAVVHITRDPAGRLLRADSEAAFLAIHPEGSGTLSVEDPQGVTRVESRAGGYSLLRGASELRVETLPDGRPARVHLPGSARPLEYAWLPDGSCTIGGVLEAGPAGIRSALGGLRVIPQPLGMELQAGAATVRMGWDGLGRTVFRRWEDGFSEFFERDTAGRLASWTHGAETRQYCYDGAELVAETEGEARWERTLDAAGRVICRDGVAYEYDAAGRRTGRNGTRYTYDAFGQLTTAGAVRFEYDGLGRRVAVHAPAGSRFEHRDAEGRLWAVTDPAGRAIHTFLWWQGRMVARIDGPVGDPVAELFATDPLGTLLGVLTVRGFERCAQPPFGAVESAARPTLYGHVGDPETGLALFGARYYDPELGLFLTPDPWHGGLDDPRLWGTATLRDLHQQRELSLGGIHPYALCQFDPAGLADFDGHQSKSASTGMSVLNGIGTFFLLPTWGWPLTAVSLFFFFPFDLYVEAVALIIALIRRLVSGTGGIWDNHPFEQQSVLRSVGAMASARQGVVAASLNGILPRFFTSLHGDSTKSGGAAIASAIKGAVQSDRAVTIGNVIWMDRYEMDRLERPAVVIVDNLTGFGTAAKSSIVVMESGAAGKKRFHAAFWSRGFGNKLAAPAAGKLHFDDVAPAAGSAQAAIHLAQPFPLNFPFDKTKNPSLQEYLKAGAVTAQAKVIRDTWFALQTGTGIKIKKDDPIEIAAPDLTPPAAVHMTASDVQTDDDFSTIILSGVLPPSFQNQKMTVWRVRPTGAETHDWKKDPDESHLKSVAPGADILGLSLATDSLVKVTGAPAAAPAAPPPAAAAPAGPAVQYARVQTVTIKLELSDPLTDNATANDKVFLLEPDGSASAAEALDPPAADKFKWTGSSGASSGDLVSITLGAGAAAKVTFGLVKDSADSGTLEIELAGPDLGATAKAAVSVRKLKDKTGDDETGTIVTDAKDQVPLKVSRLGVFAKDLNVHFKVGGKDQIRSIKSIAEIGLALAEKAAGGEPYTLQVGELDDDSRIKKAVTAKLHRFLEYVSGSNPSAFGAYPDFILNIGPKGYDSFFDRLSNCYIQTSDAAFDPNFHPRWKPFTRDGKDYFVLERDLPFEEKDANIYWRSEPDDSSDVGRTQLNGFGPDELVTLTQFQKAGGAARGTVTPAEPLVLVPEHPSEADTHAEALRQHELHHAQQNTHWGPLMGALPIAGIERIIELATTSGADKAAWLQKTDEEKSKAVDQFHGVQYVSMGSLMQLAWMYFFTWGAGHNVRFETWNRLFNPLAGNIIASFPDLDPDAPLNTKVGPAILQIVNTFTDLRTWTPFIGWIPAWLPDGACSFLEQGASRASGDLYSTILSADDKFNYQTGLRCSPHVGPTSSDANLTKPIGQAVRLLLFPAHRSDHVINTAVANVQDSPVGYAQTFDSQEPLIITSSVDVLVHPDLFELIPPAPPAAPPAPATVALPAPVSIAGGAAVNFITVPASTQFRPTLRAMVPVPPAVNRTAGWYFLPMTPATYSCVGFYDEAKDDSKNAHTQEVLLTFTAGDVSFGTDKVAYAPPTAAAPASAFERFIGEEQAVAIDQQPFKDAAWWELNATESGGTALPADFVKATPQSNGWKLKIAKDKLAADKDVRVRLYRILRANDAAHDENNDPVFDLTFDPKKHPTLVNVRSYLEKTVWYPIRDFVVTVKNMPPLATDLKPKITTEDPYSLNLALPLTGNNAPVTTLTPPAPAGSPPAKLVVARTGNKGTQPRGEEWRMEPVGGVLEDTAKYKIAVTYDSGVAVDPLELTIDPFVKIAKAGGQADFVASEPNPCLLDISGGAAPYTVSTESFPSTASASVSGTRITVAVKDLASNTKGTVVVTDANGKKGRRTVQLQKV